MLGGLFGGLFERPGVDSLEELCRSSRAELAKVEEVRLNRGKRALPDAEAVRRLGGALRKCPRVRRLELTAGLRLFWAVEPGWAQALAEHVLPAVQRRLRELVLDGQNFSRADLRLVVDALAGCKRLESLTLGNMRLSGAAHVLALALAAMPKLEEVVLEMCWWGPKSSAVFMRWLRGGCARLTTLRLPFGGLDERGARELARAVRGMPRLRTLVAANNRGFGAPAVVALVRALREHGKIERLDLSRCRLLRLPLAVADLPQLWWLRMYNAYDEDVCGKQWPPPTEDSCGSGTDYDDDVLDGYRLEARRVVAALAALRRLPRSVRRRICTHAFESLRVPLDLRQQKKKEEEEDDDMDEAEEDDEDDPEEDWYEEDEEEEDDDDEDDDDGYDSPSMYE